MTKAKKKNYTLSILKMLSLHKDEEYIHLYVDAYPKHDPFNFWMPKCYSGKSNDDKPS